MDNFANDFPQLPPGTGANHELGKLEFDPESISPQNFGFFSLPQEIIQFISRLFSPRTSKSLLATCKIGYQVFSPFPCWPLKSPFQIVSSLVGCYHYDKHYEKNRYNKEPFSLAIELFEDATFEGTLFPIGNKKKSVEGKWTVKLETSAEGKR